MTGPGSETATEPSAGVATDAPVDPTEPRGTTPGEPPARSGLALRDLVDEALSSAFARPGRAVLTALGTVLGIVTLVATAGLSRTAGQQIVDRFDELAASTVDVQPATVPGGPDGSKRVVVGNPMGWDAPRRVDRLAGVDAAATLSDVVLAQGQTVTAVPVVDPSAPPVMAPPVIATSPNLLRAIRGRPKSSTRIPCSSAGMSSISCWVSHSGRAPADTAAPWGNDDSVAARDDGPQMGAANASPAVLGAPDIGTAGCAPGHDPAVSIRQTPSRPFVPIQTPSRFSRPFTPRSRLPCSKPFPWGATAA